MLPSLLNNYSVYVLRSLDVTIVQLSLKGHTHVFRKEIIQKALRQINLNPKCLDDNYYYYYDTGNDQQHWSKLSEMIMKHNALSEKIKKFFNEIFSMIIQNF